MNLAHRVPDKLAYWVAIRVIVYGTQGEYSTQVVPDLTAMDAIKRWHDGHGNH